MSEDISVGEQLGEPIPLSSSSLFVSFFLGFGSIAPRRYIHAKVSRCPGRERPPSSISLPVDVAENEEQRSAGQLSPKAFLASSYICSASIAPRKHLHSKPCSCQTWKRTTPRHILHADFSKTVPSSEATSASVSSGCRNVAHHKSVRVKGLSLQGIGKRSFCFQGISKQEQGRKPTRISSKGFSMCFCFDWRSLVHHKHYCNKMLPLEGRESHHPRNCPLLDITGDDQNNGTFRLPSSDILPRFLISSWNRRRQFDPEVIPCQRMEHIIPRIFPLVRMSVSPQPVNTTHLSAHSASASILRGSKNAAPYDHRLSDSLPCDGAKKRCSSCSCIIGITLRLGLSGKILTTVRMNLNDEVHHLRQAAFEAMNAATGTTFRGNVKLSVFIGGELFPREGTLLDALLNRSHACLVDSLDPLVVDIVQHNGLELTVQQVPTSDCVLRNRAFVCEADMKIIQFMLSSTQNSNCVHVELNGIILALEIHTAVRNGSIAMSLPLRQFARCLPSESVFVTPVVPSDLLPLRHCSLQADVKSFFLAAWRTQKIRVSRDAIRSALRAVEGQVVALGQPLVIQPSIESPRVELTILNLTCGSPDSNRAFMDSVNCVEFVEGPTKSIQFED